MNSGAAAHDSPTGLDRSHAPVLEARHIVQEGRQLFERALSLAEPLRIRIGDVPAGTRCRRNWSTRTRPSRTTRWSWSWTSPASARAVTRSRTGCARSGRLDVGAADHRRVVAHVTHADGEASAGALLDAPTEPTGRNETLPGPVGYRLPTPVRPRLAKAMLA